MSAAKLVIFPLLCVLLVSQAFAASPAISKPEEAGFSPERIKRVHDVVQRHIDAKEFAGAVTLVARKGKVVHFEAQGTTDFESGKAMSTDTLFAMKSMTKPVTAVAVLMLMEEGKLSLSDPVSKFIPEFKNPKVAVWNLPNDPRGPGLRFVSADREVTLQHLLTHTAGLTVNANGPTGDLFRQAKLGQEGISLAEFCRRAGSLPLAFQPGTQWQYTGGVGFAVLGRVVEIVSGMNLDKFVRERILTPLKMNNTFFTVPQNRTSDVATVYVRTDQGLVKPPPQAPLPAGVEFFSGAGGLTGADSGGLTGSAEDYLQFCEMLLNGGKWNGARLLSRKSVELMTDNAIGDLDLGNLSDLMAQNLRGYGFGLSVRVRKSTGASGALGSPGDYGWTGAFGTYFWVDPKEQLIGIILMANRVVALATEFPNTVYQALDD